ncbi:hypothetical protein BH09PLA1_BH09PLA1_04920 [soil metagenome]
MLLKLEGKLLTAWAGELLAELPTDPRQLAHTRLDLSRVSFIDDAGVFLLRRLTASGVVIQASSSFVAAILQTGKS